MDRAVILQRVLNADPAFVELMSRLQDPPSEARERVLERLPDLHRLFLAKRQAAELGDEVAWAKLIDQEAALVKAIDVF